MFHQAENGLLTFDPSGCLISAIGGQRWLGAHGLTRIEEQGEESLWLTDEKSCEVAKVNLRGEVLQTLPRPPTKPIAARTRALSHRRGPPNPVTGNLGCGRLWHVPRAPVLGAGRIPDDAGWHRGRGPVQRTARSNFTIGPSGPELFITDRANHRIVVYDGDGCFLRSSRSAHSPCCFEFHTAPLPSRNCSPV